jgi:hypothetical protein
VHERAACAIYRLSLLEHASNRAHSLLASTLRVPCIHPALHPPGTSSTRHRLHKRRQVRRLQLEVVSDDCRPVYTGQPTCSEVVSSLAALGFVPLTPLPCRPPMPRGDKANHRCELEMVFLNAQLGVRASDGTQTERDAYLQYHQGHFKCAVQPPRSMHMPPAPFTICSCHRSQ